MTKTSGLIHSPEQGEKRNFHFTHVHTVESRVLCGFHGICRSLIAFFLFTEERRKPEDFWSTSRAERLTSEDEEALASQQETQMIFFIQQVAWCNKKNTVAWCNKKKYSTTLASYDDALLGWSRNLPFSFGPLRDLRHSLGSSRDPLPNAFGIVTQAFLCMEERLCRKWEFVTRHTNSGLPLYLNYLSPVRKQLVIQIVSSLLLVLTALKTTIVILSFFNIIDVVICFQGKYVLE